MFAKLSSLKNLIRTKSYHIDYPLFRLHYQVTACVLLAFCLILSANIFFGDTIDCRSRFKKPDPFYDNVCFSQGTFTQYAVDLTALRLASQSRADKLPKEAIIVVSGSSDRGQDNPVQSLALTAEEKPEPSLWYSLSRGLLTFFFNDTYDGKPSKNTTILSRNSTREIINQTTVFSNSLNRLFLNTRVANFLREHYQPLQRFVRDNDHPFKSDIKYLFTGILVPETTSEIETFTFEHRYYQYISIVLFIQALFFYLPHYLWKSWENGIVSSVCQRLHDNRWSPTEFIESNFHMVEYLQNCLSKSKSLVYKYFFCHLLLLINLVVQITALNIIFNSQYLSYGVDVLYHAFIDSDTYGLRGLSDDISDLNSPMDFVFPKITACTFRTLSEGGQTLDKNEFLCILPLNILHDKFFLVLWFWLLLLTVLTVIQIVHDFLYIMLPVIRRRMFIRKFGNYLSEESKQSLSLSETFLLDLIGTNSDRFAFNALLRKLNRYSPSSLSENQSLV